VQIVSDTSHISHDSAFTGNTEQILELLERRPCTVQDIASGIGISEVEVGKFLEHMFARNQVKIWSSNGEMFYQADLP